MKKLCLFLLCLCAAFMAQSQIIINEVESDAGNHDGTGGDWIELKNIGTTPEDLSCWRLTNGGSVILTIPNGLILPDGAYLLIGDASKMMCATCDYKSMASLFTLNASGFGQGSGTYANTIFLNTDVAINGGCDCMNGSGDFNNGTGIGDRVVLFDNTGTIADAMMFAGGNKYGTGALTVYFVGTSTCGVTSLSLPAVGNAAYAGRMICNDLSGCNSSYSRWPDGNNGAVVTYDQSGIGSCATCSQPCLPGATNKAATNFPTPGLSNSNTFSTWQATLNGNPVGAVTSTLSVCGATPITFEYTINGFTNVALTPTQLSGNLGSYITVNGGTPANFTSATYNAAAGITTLTATIIPPNGTTTYEFVWAEGNSNCTTCPGTSSSPNVNNPASAEQECYTYRKLIVNRENPLTGSPTATCSSPGTITVSGASGTNVQYTLYKQTTTGGAFLSVGGPFTSNIIANIIDDDADPTLPNYQVWVSSNNTACVNPSPLIVSVPNSCLGNPPCPMYVSSGSGAPVFTPASGSTVCRNTNATFSVSIKGVCNTGQIEVKYGFDPAFDPYTSGISLGSAGTNLGATPPSTLATGKVFINEFVPRPGAGTCGALGITPNGASPNSGEWVELYNAGPGNVDISGWSISDGDWTATIPSGTIMANGGYYLIGGGGTFCSSGVLPDLNIETCNCATVSPTTQDIMNLTDGGEQLALFDCSGTFIDGVYWNAGQAVPDTTANTAPSSGCGNYIPQRNVNLPGTATTPALTLTGSSFSGTTQGRYRTSTNTWLPTSTSGTVPTPKAMNTGGNWIGTGTNFGTQCPAPPVTSALSYFLPDTCNGNTPVQITVKAIYHPDPTAPCTKGDVTATATYTIPTCETLTLSGSAELCQPATAPISITTSSALVGTYDINLSNGVQSTSINSVSGAGPFTGTISTSGNWFINSVTAPTGICPPKGVGTAQIIIHPIPVISAAPASTSFCYQYGFDLSSVQSSLVSVPSTNQYVWYDSLTGGSPIFPYVNPGSSQTYYVAATTGAPAFCENTNRTPIVLTIDPLPEVPAITCNGMVLSFFPPSPDCIPIPCSNGLEYSADGTNWGAGPSFSAADPGWAGFGTASTGLVYIRNAASPSCFNYVTYFNPCFAPLPTTLFHFYAHTNSDKSIGLVWETAQEKNVSHFEIQRSGSQSGFVALGQQKANGNTSSLSTYTFQDVNPLNGVNYYRLKMVDEDGAFVYSNIIQQYNDRQTNGIKSVYPNPVRESLSVEMNVDQRTQTQIRIYNTLGQLLIDEPLHLQRGYNLHNLSVESLEAGTYLLQIELGAEKMVRRFVKE